jgi:hypothetical protein
MMHIETCSVIVALLQLYSKPDLSARKARLLLRL